MNKFSPALNVTVVINQLFNQPVAQLNNSKIHNA